MPERRVVTQNIGKIEPNDMASYLEYEGFAALKEATDNMPPERIIEEVKASGLQGRGGAGFNCGLKWELARKAGGKEKFLIVNADEGEVGTFKDRFLMENDPFTLIEGLAIAGRAIGAKTAYIYLRAEYHYLVKNLLKALSQAKEHGFLPGLEVRLVEGAGAYICGEESALMNSIEGLRGEARFKPPFPPESGLWQSPTIINNVETLMNVPRIILNGPEWFSEIGTENSKGTKLFSVSGDVARPGVYEMVMGSSLKELVLDLAGASEVKLVQLGGASGRIIPMDRLDTPLSYETVLGSGAVTVFDRTRDVLDIVHRTIEFLAEESCGKCAPCREGTEAMMEILSRLTQGEGMASDIDALQDLSRAMADSSLCGLGQSAPIPVMDTLNHFRRDYENRIEQSRVLRHLGSFH
ncbi:MAG: NADP oxidoreductase [Deltaproteobacteria bacterium]|nr:NADP oxidoreductase [Deltaproteobacteria bacterium]